MVYAMPIPQILEGWLPPTRANWELIVWSFQFFPIVRPPPQPTHSFHVTTCATSPSTNTDHHPLQFTAVQWLTDFYPQGKTSIPSRYNLNGHLAWFLMEIPGLLAAWYCFLTIPSLLPDLSTEPTNSFGFAIPSLHPLLDLPATWSNRNGAVIPPAMTPWSLPVGNKTLLGLYTIHYLYRAVLCPIVNPSMSPIHPLVFFSAAAWQVLNGVSIAGYIAGYGKSSVHDWAGRAGIMPIGLLIWGWAWLGNMFHDDELREIRREAARSQRKEKETNKNKTGEEKRGDGQKKVDVSKVYMLPKNGLFRYILYPHYLCEWIEWTGFWVVGGGDFLPGRTFVVNEVATMLPRALGGWRWYVQRFGRERIAGRKAIIPFLL